MSSSSKLLGLTLAGVSALALTPRTCHADGKTGELKEKVDFSKPPAEVENYNKYRFKVEGLQGAPVAPDLTTNNYYKRLKERLAELQQRSGSDADTEARKVKERMEVLEKAVVPTTGLTLSVEGEAYYPDGVVLQVGVRYWKHMNCFYQERAIVKDRRFSCKLGPFERKLPRGKLTVDVYFLLEKQPIPVRRAMEEGRFFSCSPPCRFDRFNVTHVDYDLGGDKGQEKAEADEKGELKTTVEALVGARELAYETFAQVRKQAKSAEDAKAALTRLDQDVHAALELLSLWAEEQQFALFPEDVARIESFGMRSLVEGQLHASVAGVIGLQVAGATRVNGTGRATTFQQYSVTREEVESQLHTIRGFLAEVGTLDRRWKKEEVDLRGRLADVQAKALEKGMVFYKGEWISPQERDRREALDKKYGGKWSKGEDPQ